ncbi:hypothetical protein Pcinc_029030 [Petrolisthes cinctipes]|uniref:Uncharacterized protein n=1 Tax=Petrolisthes cinctipes TaxID=88211 RepID=A0AAE1F1S1_PETCI|nr:hypothetical protein Pcinc_029030 [Petrolisthes cinctipes]
MVVSRSPAASQAVEGKLKFGSITRPLQDHVKILGVTFDVVLRFDKHIHHIAHQASLRVSALRRVAGFLDKRGLMTLYKAQVRPHLEYGALMWMSSATTHLLWWSSTRLSHEQVRVPRSHTSQHQRTFTARVSRMWNVFTAAAPSVQDMSTQQVKVAAHRWRGSFPTPMIQ